jgi:hypothetical protein
MATEAVVNRTTLALKRTSPGVRRGWKRPLAAGVALGLVALLSGDRGVSSANLVQGIDPLDILNLQVKPNVVFVIDTSRDMGLVNEGVIRVGGDDPRSRLYQVKQALRQLMTDNDGKANFGIIDLNADQAQNVLSDDAPLVYVSLDPQGAQWDARFDSLSSNFPDYDGAPDCATLTPILPQCSQEIFQSFGNTGNYGVSYQGLHYMASRIFRSGVRYTYNTAAGSLKNQLQAVTTIDCAVDVAPPPVRLLGDDTDFFNDGQEHRACFQLEDQNNPGVFTTYYLASPTYTAPAAAQCDGTTALCLVAPVPACTAGSNVAALKAGPLRLQIPLRDVGANLWLPGGVPGPENAIATVNPIGTQPNAGGGLPLGVALRPLDAALRAAASHFANTVFPNRPAAVNGLQRNFVIVITSGEDNAGGTPAATAAAMRGGGAIPAANDITTFVVAYNGEPGFAGTAAQVALNNLQAAGTLGRYPTAFGAATGDELWSSLNFAFSETIAAGVFSTESSITESIFEYAGQANTPALPGPPPTPARTFVPYDPASRYGARVPTLLQSSFEMPGFVGHLRAFQSPGASGCPAGSTVRLDASGASVCEVWDAGEKLRQRIWSKMCFGAATYAQCSALNATNAHTFAALRGAEPDAGSFSNSHPQFKPVAAALLQRRILTTSRQGVFAYQSNLSEPFGPTRSPSTDQCPVPLWPPTAGSAVGGCNNVGPVAPTADATPGMMDGPLGIANLSFQELQSRFAACLGAPAGHACLDPTLQLARARREARETILAFTAGAQQAQVAGIPQRCQVPPLNLPCDGTGSAPGDILYVARFWPLAESTLAVPAVVPPPLEAMPVTHAAEYLLFRDGVRDSTGAAPSTGNPAASGFGLRNPDKNAGPGIGAPSAINGNFEPLMTVIYHAANDMVHAFRGGPCPGGSCAISGGSETGGEELWGFVPFDQLDKLQDRLEGQGRSPHTYVVASSVRFNDVFVPGTWTETATGRTFLGRWRTIMVLGRGIAGKSYTALDITSPGQFTRSSLDTLPPFPIWSRGNPDTTLGIGGGAANSTTDPDGDDGANDTAAYANMGETWSVPAMAAVKPEFFFDKEFVMFMGSGYRTGNNVDEGKTFYGVDALTGDVLYAPQAPDSTNSCSTIDPGETCPVPNALVANAAAFIPSQLSAGFVGNPAASTAKLVYIGDLHGRMWKFITSRTGLGLIKIQPNRAADAVFGDSPDQPIGSAVALLNLGAPATPHVYWETGNDIRVIPPDPFKFVSMDDKGADINATVTATGLFNKTLNGALFGFRGTAQPATAFNATGLGRVFFIGTKFSDHDVQGSDCKSRFDSVLFAVGAVSGNAVYDLDNSGSITAADQSFMVSGKINAIRGSMGQIILDKGDIDSTGTAGVAPQAPPAPAAAPTANEGSSGEVFMSKLKPNSNVCR